MTFLQWVIPEKIHTPNRWYAGNSRKRGVEGSGNLGGGRGPSGTGNPGVEGGVKNSYHPSGGGEFFLEQPNHKNCEN